DTLRVLGSPAAHWAAYYHGAVVADVGNYAPADQQFQRIIREATAAEPAVLGKATWMRGVTELRQGNYEVANRFYFAAQRYFEQAKDTKNQAAVSYLLAEGLALAGQSMASFEVGYRGLRDLAPFRQAFYLHNHLIIVAAFARSAGLR